MKRALYYLLSLTIISSIFSCKKDKIPVSDSIVGTWELSMDINGMTGHVTQHKPGNDTLAIFTTDGKYSFYNRNNLFRSGSYTVKRDTYSMDHTVRSRIIFDNAYDNSHEFFDIQNNLLNMYIDAYDSGGVGYRRIK
ncbi:MAG TPA: hypothetical protein VFE54_08790 [Mucilaginibacter sp.]|jgi:hypothetical protein|nr:hypothetical protein [Mucilaginibacter sp.]